MTAPRYNGKMITVTLRQLRRRARLTASSVTVAIAVALFATCVSAAEMTPEQKACCAAMAHDCGHMAIETSCCAGEVHTDTGLVAAKLTVSTSPAGTLIPTTATPTVLAVPNGRFRIADRSPLRSTNVPTYLFVSSFRI